MGFRVEQVPGDQQPVMELSKPPIMLQHPPEQPPPSEAVNCPRCGSTNTKFCYYNNNYNKSQPRHYCKACKRHWTKGGTLRNLAVGGGRKKKCNRTSTGSGNRNKMNTPPAAGLYEFSANYSTRAEFGFTSFSTPFKENASLLNMNPISYQNFHDPWDLYSMESSSIITLDIPTTSNIPLDLTGYCNWDEIDPLTTPLDLSIEFDNVHGEIKP